MKRISTLFALALLLSVSALAQDKAAKPAPEAKPAESAAKPAALPSTDEVLEKYIKAIGGKEVIEKVTSRASKGTMEIEAMNMSGSVEMYEKAPNKNAMVLDLPGFGKINNVYDGSKGYSSDPMSGLRELSGLELAAAQREADIYAPLNMKKNYKSLVVTAREKVGAADAFVLIATPSEGEAEKFYFDANTGLMIRQDTERESPQGKMPIEMYFEDYKVVEGMKMPHQVRQVTPMFSATIKLTEVKVNAPIEDTKFAKPSGN
jgi:hypothetical protein